MPTITITHLYFIPITSALTPCSSLRGATALRLGKAGPVSLQTYFKGHPQWSLSRRCLTRERRQRTDIFWNDKQIQQDRVVKEGILSTRTDWVVSGQGVWRWNMVVAEDAGARQSTECVQDSSSLLPPRGSALVRDIAILVLGREDIFSAPGLILICTSA